MPKAIAKRSGLSRSEDQQKAFGAAARYPSRSVQQQERRAAQASKAPPAPAPAPSQPSQPSQPVRLDPEKEILGTDESEFRSFWKNVAKRHLKASNISIQ